jgi:hypothetical protein
VIIGDDGLALISSNAVRLEPSRACASCSNPVAARGDGTGVKVIHACDVEDDPAPPRPLVIDRASDQVQESVNYSAEQYREKLLATVASDDNNQAFVNAVITGYEKKFDVDQVTEQLVAIYDKHYSSEEIKELLQFYGSPIGQRVATEAAKISREIQAATRATAAKAVKDALQETKEEHPRVGQNAHLTTAPARRLQQRRGTQDPTQAAQQQDQP